MFEHNLFKVLGTGLVSGLQTLKPVVYSVLHSVYSCCQPAKMISLDVCSARKNRI